MPDVAIDDRPGAATRGASSSRAGPLLGALTRVLGAGVLAAGGLVVGTLGAGLLVVGMLGPPAGAVVPSRTYVKAARQTSQPSLTVTTQRWALPLAESRQAVCWNGSALVELGGLVAGDTSSAGIFVIAPSSGAVRAKGSLAEAVHDAAAACLSGRSIVFGGGSFNTVAAVQEWSGSGAARVVGALPAPRSDLTAVAVGRTAYVLGGFDGTTMQPTVLATTDGAHFNVAGRLKVGVRYPAVAAGGGYIWVAGGQVGTTEGGGGQTNVVQRFDPRTGKTAIVAHLPEMLGHASAAFLHGVLWVAGGVTGTTTSARIWAVHPATGQVRLAALLPAPRSNAGTVVANGTAYLLGGEGPAGPVAPLSSVVELRAGN